MREAPSIPIITKLILEGANIRAHDPVAGDKARFVLPPKVKICEEIKDTLDGADAVMIITEWPIYQELTPELMKERMRGNLVVDGRNCLDPHLFAGQMRYIGVGRGSNFERQATVSSQMAI
jgi:UDPglucose 6-dehydrogenase